MKVFELNLICRVCLTKASNLKDIFDTQNDISILLMTFAAIRVLKNDGLPSQVCKSCVERATMSSEFKKLCEESDFKLREYVSSNVEIKQETIVNSFSGDEDNVDTFDDEWLPDSPIDLMSKKSTQKKIPKKKKALKKENKDTEHSCARCDSVYYNDFDLKVHQASHRNKNGTSHICPFCQENLKRRCRLIEHMAITHVKKSNHECEHCCCYFTTYRFLRKHMKKSHGTNLDGDDSRLNDDIEIEPVKIEVEDCVDNVKNEPNLDSNVEVNLKRPKKEEIKPKKSYKTSQFKTKKLMMKQSTDEKQNVEQTVYKCDECHKQFTKEMYLYKHKLRHSEEIFLCATCGKCFRSKYSLQKHILNHTEDRKPYECPICGKTARIFSAYNNHIRSHRDKDGKYLISENSNEKHFSCSMCEKSFRTKTGLDAHKNNIHYNKFTKKLKKRECKMCGKELSSLGKLKDHLRSHTGEKPYECKWCFRRFTRSDLLSNHVRRHLGEKPYSCRVCGKAFASRCDALSHERRNICQKQLNNKNETDKYDYKSHPKLFIPNISMVDIKSSEKNDILKCS